MRWQSKYLVKLALQKVLGAVPGLFRLQESYKRWRNNWTGVVDADFVLSETESRIADFKQAGLAVPRVVVEQGTGWHGTDLVIFALAGVREIHTYDTTPWLRAELLGQILRLAPRMAPIVSQWPGLDEPTVSGRAEELAALASKSLEKQLAGLRCTAHVTRATARPELEDDSVDLFYSNSVLQRVPMAELEDVLAESARFLRRGAQGFHIVDTKDFHSITDPAVPELGYLRWSERQWRLATSPFLNYQNRLRSPQFVRLFEQAGFETHVTERRVAAENLAYAAEHFSCDPRFEEMSLEGLATTQTKLYGQVPVAAAARPDLEGPTSPVRAVHERRSSVARAS